jgi:hypothetical protein
MLFLDGRRSKRPFEIRPSRPSLVLPGNKDCEKRSVCHRGVTAQATHGDMAASFGTALLDGTDRAKRRRFFRRCPAGNFSRLSGKSTTRETSRAVTAMVEGRISERPSRGKSNSYAFRADVHVRQKHYSNGVAKGPLYLRADNSSIIKIAEPTTDEVQVARQRRGTISGRTYDYIVIRSAYDSFQKKLFRLRIVAYSSAKETSRTLDIASIRRERLKLIADYARLRSEGFCEACEKPAPFIRRNNDPYL